jgi:hypothetical protein
MCGPAVRSLVVLFASFASSFLTNVRYFPFIDFGVEEGPSSGRTVRLYLAETAKRQVDSRPGCSFLCGRIDSTGHWSLSIGDRKGQDGVNTVRKMFRTKTEQENIRKSTLSLPLYRLVPVLGALLLPNYLCDDY